MATTKQLPIVQSLAAYDTYPFEAIAPDVLQKLNTLALPRSCRRDPVIRAFECYLRITGCYLTFESFAQVRFNDVYRGFIGALASPIFIERPPLWIQERIRTVNALLLSLSASGQLVSCDLIKPTKDLASDRVLSCRRTFDAMPLNEESVWLIRSWIVEDLRGIRTTLPIYPIYKRLGREFATKLHHAFELYISGRRGLPLTGLKELAAFIHAYPDPISASSFQEPAFVTTFWRGFLESYFTERYGEGNDLPISSLITVWRKHITQYVERVLQESGLFAAPFGQFPRPPPRYVRGDKTNTLRTESGVELKTKLLTHVPLQISDEQSMHILFEQIRTDFNIVVDWANWAVNDLWNRHCRRERLAETGVARDVSIRVRQKWLTDKDDPLYLNHAAAAFKKYGYAAPTAVNQKLYPRSCNLMAYELGLVTAWALHPHWVVLIAEHPALTPAALESFELYDTNGKLTGISDEEGRRYMVTFKRRKGSTRAQTNIQLSQRASEVIDQLIALTTPLREVLRSRGDDNWRLLFLHAGRGFNAPRPMTAMSICGAQRRDEKNIAEDLSNTSDLPYADRLSLANRFTLSALRASAGTMEYLRTGSVEAMSKILGHTEYCPKLMKSYLPEPIRCFFQERWIRIFQEGLIIEALKDSPYLLQATEFKNMQEVDEFLSNHALRKLPEHAIAIPQSHSTDEIVFGVDTGILTILLSLEMAVGLDPKRAHTKAHYWALLSSRLTHHIESNLDIRSDIQHSLKQARQHAKAELMGAAVYGC